MIENLEYTYPSEGGRSVNSIYGAMVNGKANCEGYSRSLKWLLEAYNIPTVLVSGVGVNSLGNSEAHMWNYVQIEEKWYAVDATWDDPIGGNPRSIYLLTGSDRLVGNHASLGGLSYGAKEFTYPQLNELDYKAYQGSLEQEQEEVTYDKNGGLEVKTRAGTDEVGDSYTIFSFSYNGKNMEEANKDGVYLASRVIYNKQDMNWLPKEESVSRESEEQVVGVWNELSAFKLPVDSENPNANIAQVFKKCYIQFCATTKAPDGQLGTYTYDLSDQENLGLSKKMATPAYSDYVAPPYVRKSTPSLGKCITGGQKQHYVVEYDEKLAEIVPGQPIEMKVTASSSGMEDYKLENLKVRESTYRIGDVERPCTIFEFDFTPSSKYQAYTNVYSLQPTNLRSTNEKQQAPNPFPISTTFPMKLPCNAFVIPGTIPDAFVIANPSLIVNEAMDVFEDYNGNKVNSLDIRLIATKMEGTEETDLTGSIPESDKIKSSATFDLTLSCNSTVARLKSDTDYNVTIALPYPENFNYEDNKNVEFKAYHYKLEANGTYTPEELICKITPQGLVVIANSFSPFSVVAMAKDPNAPAKEQKLVMVSSETAGGTITTLTGGKDIGASGLFTLSDAENEKTFKVQADTGYIIDKIVIDGKVVGIEKNICSYTQTFQKDTMSADSTMRVYFIAESVQEKDKAEGFKPVLPGVAQETPEYSDATLESADKTIILSGKFENGTSVNTSDVASEEIKAAFQNYNKEAAILKMVDISLSEEHAYEGKLRVDFLLEDAYAGKKLTVLHYVNGAVVAEGVDLLMSAGKIGVEVDTLSPFAIIDQVKKSPNPGDSSGTQKLLQTNKSVKTGDTASLLPYIIGMGAAIIVIAGLIFYRKKKR